MRRYVVPLLLLLPSAFAAIMYGCGSGEPPIEDFCGWLADPTNCYREFGKDIRPNGILECTQLSLAENEVPQLGEFLTRDKLDTCILRSGGIIKFGTPPDLAALPPTEVAFDLVNTDLTMCGSVDYLAPDSFTLTINGSNVADAGPEAAKGVKGGTFKVTPMSPQPDRATTTAECPLDKESHYFDTLEDRKCPQYKAIEPRALLEVDTGGLDEDGNPGGTWGAIKFWVYFPPVDGALENAKPDVIQMFSCAIPAAPDVCANGALDPGETDIDCGGSFCATRCCDMQKCISNSDCVSGVCGLDKGVKKCVGPAKCPNGEDPSDASSSAATGSSSSSSGGGGGAGGSGGAGG